MSEGADLDNPDVRNKLFEVAGFRVEYRSFDPGTELTLNENGSYRFAAPTESVEETGSYRFEDGVLTLTDKNGRQIVGQGNPIRLSYPISEEANLAGSYAIPADSLGNSGPKELKSQAQTLHGYAIIDCAKVKYTNDWQRIRGTRIATVFQDPMTSLNPIIPIGKQIMTVILKHQKCSKAEARQRTIDIMGKVGIPDPESRFDDYPFEYSGGMRQRIVIAIALSCQPKILICDEPTTALDVTIQAQILQLIKDLQKDLGFTTVYITHDLGVVANVAERVAVLYAGQIVEMGTVEEIFYEPKHPYTWALLSSLPQLSERGSDLFYIPGTPPSLYNKLVGDAFAPRSQYAMAIDLKEEAPMIQVSPTHFAKTWLLDPRAPKTEPPANIQNLHEKIKKTYVSFEQ
ncbi:MAG: ABC transporter ATP-binding protein [Oscillospiraceae bacterium]|nr:ABC transporter ATP-binding protein [Oscillospiraceae bacterium]